MLDLKIDRLQLNIANAAGHEHRVRPITEHAVALLAERLAERVDAAGQSPAASAVESLSAAPVSFDLSRMSDAQAAEAIAGAWLEALALKLRV
jgi:hypothetical protein